MLMKEERRAVDSRRNRFRCSGISEQRRQFENIKVDIDDEGSDEEAQSDSDNENVNGPVCNDTFGIEELSIAARQETEESESEDELTKNMIARGPEKRKETIKEHRFETMKPYPEYRQCSGGSVIVRTQQLPNLSDDMLNLVPDPFDQNLVPQPVEDHFDIDSIVVNFTAEELEVIEEALNSEKKRIDDDLCDSPGDSGYSMSPASQPSPYYLHSPNPVPIEKYDSRLLSPVSESHWEQLPVQSEYQYNFQQDFNTVLLSAEPRHAGMVSKAKPQAKLSPAPISTSSLNIINQKSQHNIRESNTFSSHLFSLPSRPNRCLQPSGISINESELDMPTNERMKKRLKPKTLENAWTAVCIENETLINAKNKKNQTALMQILLLKETPYDFQERIFARVERIKKEKRAALLSAKDEDGHTAVYMACLLHKNKPLIARYIADAYAHLNCNVNEGSEQGNTLIHDLTTRGNDYSAVLAELLHSTKPDGRRTFDVNKQNKKTYTPLHLAASIHSNTISMITNTSLLLRNGADATIQEENGNTPLHLAIKHSCDPSLVKLLLQNPKVARDCINLKNLTGNTPLHIAASRNDINLEKQFDVIMQLKTSKAKYNIQNCSGHYALSLVHADRKEAIKNILS